MTIKLGMILLGTLLIYGGWRNLSVQALIFGDNTTPKTSSNWPTSANPNSSVTGQSASGTGSSYQGSAAGSAGEPSSSSQANAAFGIATGRVTAPTTAGQ